MVRKFRKGLLIALLVSVALSTIFCITCVVTEGRDETVMRLLGTAITFTIAILACFISMLAIERRQRRWLGCLGLIFAFPATGATVSAIWLFDPLARLLVDTFALEPYRGEEVLGKCVCTFLVPGLALPLCLCVLLPTLKSFARMIQGVTVGIIIAASILSFVLLWGDVGLWWVRADELFIKLYAILLTLCVAGTIATHALARFFSIKPVELTEDMPTITLICPRCLTKQDLKVGESTCAHCRLKFKIEVEEPRCGKCGYLLRGLTRPICPECGEIFSTAPLAATVAEHRPTLPAELSVAAASSSSAGTPAPASPAPGSGV
jgi:hypothetical protein